MLKQPDRIVIYPQRDSKPGYLLCWIPPREYDYASGGNPEVEAELADYFPTGIESEFSQDGFEEFGIALPYDLEEISQAFTELEKIGLFGEVEFVDLKRLGDYVEEKDSQPIVDLLENYSKQKITLEDLKKNKVFKQLLTEPKTKGGEEPGEAFQKLSGQMENPEE